MRILAIGGSDAGIAAALRARELDHSAEVSVALADDFPNFSICGLPFYLSGETPDWRSLAHRTEFEGIEILRSHRVSRIDSAAHVVEVQAAGGEVVLPYDRLIVATGAVPVRPSLPGIDLPGVHLLHHMADAFTLHARLESDSPPRSVAIVGAGYIGIEMADALSHRGLHVTLVSRTDPVFPTVDAPFGAAIADELGRHGVDVLAGREVEAIKAGDPSLAVCVAGGGRVAADLVLIAVGTRPEAGLAIAAGAETGIRDAVKVDRQMRTRLEHVFAAGDCAETWHRVLDRPTWLPLGTTAHKQGRIAGENAVGGHRTFAGAVGTQAVKVFDLVVARTGLLEREARAAGMDATTTELKLWDHKAYYPGAQAMRVRVVGDRCTGKLLGAQILGSTRSEVSKRIDVFAAALFHRMDMESLNDLDLSYTPPLSSPWDPVQATAQAWSHANKPG
jgi:NADPH-dependent 2,4-dienoyl-CoA reductase/sulfur reductase-like enzyme